MPNVLTSLAADIYRAADVVGREQVGIITSVTLNGGAQAAALNDAVRSHFTRPAVVGGIAPSMTIPEGTDQTVDNKSMTLDTPASVKIPWTGEDIKHVNNGSGFETVYGDQIAQAMRAITNQIEGSLWQVAYKGASRAFGTPGTPPFASNFNEIPQVRKILVDNGCPFNGEMTLAIDTTAGANLRSIATLQKANENGSDAMLRQGELLDLQGFKLKESAGISLVTKGAGTGFTTTAAGFPVGTTSIPLIAGSGAINQGDVITFAGDTNKYVVNTGTTGPGTITISSPGLRQAIPASATAVTVGNSYTGNIAFHRAAIELAMRPFAAPPGGDAAVDEMMVMDPRSGLSFVIRAYKGYMKSMFDVQCLYGTKAWKGDFIALLQG